MNSPALSSNNEQKTENRSPRTAKAGNLLSQWWTLGRLLRDKRRSPSHDAVFWVILNAHRESTGRCPASVRFIKTALAGSIVSSDTIVFAINDLEEWGYVERLPRLHRSAPTEFIPRWVTEEFIPKDACVPADRNTDACVPVDWNAGVPEVRNTGVPAHWNESYLLTTEKPEGSKVDSLSANGGPAANAPAAVPGFERVWQAYGKHGNKQASREAFAVIAEPDVDHITERAAAWAASAKPGQRRMPLEKWLAAEKYDEADRLTKKAKPATTTANDNHDEDDVVKICQKIPSPPRRIGTHIGKIAAAREESSPDGNRLVLTFEDGGTRSFFAEAADTEKQEAGQRELAMLSEIAGLLEVEDAAQLEGIKFSLTEYDDGSARWEAA